MARLSHLGVIRAEGEDAAKFLHGQLTQDFALLGLEEARLAAFCSAKGRMQASFIGFKRSPTDILLVCNRDLLAATLKRLSMFVMRAKAKLTDASEAFAVYGLAGSATQSAPADKPWAATRSGEATLVNLYPADGVARQLWVAPVAEPAPAGAQLALESWLWGEVRSGIATLSQPVFEAFVPQMLNYESVGGVNFKKGCYPGQEVVARSQFRGTLKRRGFIAHGPAPLAAGQEVFHSEDAEQPVGLVVQAAAAPQGGWDAIVSLQLSALPSGSLHAGASTGPVLEVLPLPYALLDDI
ncbi:MAG: folate-binding protein YgfZ [Rhodoferax sp.]|nr:folate-binding protein YgfZ [Rhodoferax sp.]